MYLLDKYINEILTICANTFDLSIEDIKSDKRNRNIVYCRKACSIIIKEQLDVNLEYIGRSINKTGSAVSSYISSQPDNNYYKICISQCKKIIQETFKKHSNIT